MKDCGGFFEFVEATVVDGASLARSVSTPRGAEGEAYKHFDEPPSRGPRRALKSLSEAR